MEYKSEIELTGTSTLAVVYDGGVIVAADTRTTSGNYIPHRLTDKLEYITDHIYCLRSGGAADTQSVAKLIRHYLGTHMLELGKQAFVKTAVRLFQLICYHNKDNLSASFIVAGVDPYEGPQIFRVPSGGSSFKEKFACAGSGSIFIIAYCESQYKDNMSFEEAKKFATTALSLAMSKDSSSGGCIRLVNITKEGSVREFIPYSELAYKK